MSQNTAQQAAIDLAAWVTPGMPLEEKYGRLASQLFGLQTPHGDPVRRLGVTSCARQSGTSTVVIQLAAALCRCCDVSVILVDANREHSWFDQEFPQVVGPGLLNALSGDAEASDCVRPTTVSNLSVVTLGKPVWAEVDYSRASLAEAFHSLSEHADLLLLDLPVVSPNRHWEAVTRHLDGVLLVVTPEQSRSTFAVRVRHLLSELKVELLAVVLNQWAA